MTIALLLSLTNACAWGNSKVCGVDYKTYPNQCALAAAYVQLLHMGACTRVKTEQGTLVTNCSQVYEPVCGKDAVTYMNKCRMEANDAVLAYNAPCGTEHFKPYRPPLVCNCKGSPFRPVCALSGYSTENRCVLNCTQQIAQSSGPCQQACGCKGVYRPVCGVSGLTYDSACHLECVGELK